MAKRQKSTRFSIKDFDMAHYRTTESYVQAVDKLFSLATTEITNAASKEDFNPDKPFSFDDYPKVKAQMQKTIASLTNKVQAVVETGSKKQWLFSCKKNDSFIKSIFDTTKLKKSELKKMQDRNLDALSSFQARKVSGLNLSQRVWKYTNQFKQQIEHALDVGLGEGRSAQELSMDVRQNLNDPNRLFRRVRDKRGNLVLSKAAQAFHPGQGVYRSSYKNAMRLTRSEINMAYRESDWQRWQNLDFVVGFEIMRSNHEPLCKCSTCEKLVGRYPKTFKFVGWHPQCMCFAIPIMEDFFSESRRNDRVNRLKAALKGTEYKKYVSPETITKMPDGFNEWVEAHIEAQKNWSSNPYFIRDNFKNGNLADGLKISIPVVPDQQSIVITPQENIKPEAAAEQVQQPMQFEAKTPQEAIDFITANIANGCTLPIKKKDLPMVNQIINQVAERMKQFGISKFKNVGVCASKKASASWTEFNELNFNLSQMKPERVMKAVQSWERKGIKYTHYEGIDDVIRATIDHELGHKLYGLYGMRSSTTKAFGKAAVTRNGFNEMNEVLGYYASTDEQEYFAEAVARWMGRGRKGVVGYTKELMEELMAKVEGKVGVSPIATTEGIHVLGETKLEAAINKARKKLVRQEREKMVVLNSKGVSILETDGVSFNVFFDDETAKKIANATITHNHPTGKGEMGVLRLGFSLSSDDVYEAIRCNTRGIIAEAPYYRYSIERPNNGWRVDAELVRKRYREVHREITEKYGASLTKHHAKNIIQHLTMKQLAKEFGFTYKYEKKG